ncbi:ATP-dependent DNA helicase RecG [Thermodesulfatator indicus DSM 15286]|uniref:ATP-dependent DNA helicase RecG n=1 Tax=Thermodesulfatator indicus (strain DSM 15286 / JCM 11887 / CIR29812) TaxID=667014 RepID=F8ABP7_THEID|nr:ATP-dependent DNA helicase RecG [Thermodesulfatator indicus]AEH44499.1 ATP-dependent DNA helicase RecG [Thermodesulfatator indicus DSM 15286]
MGKTNSQEEKWGAVLRPLRFVSRNDFANLNKVKNLENTLKDALARIKDTLPQEIYSQIFNLLDRLDKLSFDEKKAHLEKIFSLLEDASQETLQKVWPPLEDVYIDLETYRLYRKELSKPVQFLKGVGPKLAHKLATREVKTVEDLLFFLPRTYEDRRKMRFIGSLKTGEQAVVEGEVVLSGVVKFKRRRVFEIVISDGTGLLAAKWFHFNEKRHRETFRPGRKVILAGEISTFAGRKEMIHPEVEFPEDEKVGLHVGRILPVYPTIEGVSPKVLRRIIANAVEEYAEKAISPIPAKILNKRRLLPVPLALKGIHFPDPQDDIYILNEEKSIYHKSLAFDEFFYLELALALRKSQIARAPGIAFKPGTPRVRRFLKSLPFKLTRAQTRVLKEIEKDMTSPYPMNRLLQGDVGCGKTVVAFLAALIAIDNGYQVALMAPTEILAEQHYLNFKKYAGLIGVEIALLTGGKTAREKKEIYQGLKEGHINLVIGTHALFQEAVEFKKLGLVIVDEQHRFGVLQRAALRQKAKGLEPDTLVMTATPIPRTLAMTVYGDLDVSIIDELPAGRKPVKTYLFTAKDRQKAYEIVRQELSKGHRAYVVFPLVEESEKMDLLAATTMAEHLQKELFPDYQVGLLHGKMKPSEKEAAMAAFKEGRTQILVSTTVIEVGVDVPEATVMVIENAERFGLSQLHQLRGRVGRSARESYCLLVAHKLKPGSEALRRLKILCETTDGFRIAEEDMKIRGPGEILGTRQSGFFAFRRADPVRDYDMLVIAREEAFSLLKEDPLLENYPLLKEILMERWQERLKLSEVA